MASSANNLPQIYIGGNPATRPADSMGMSGIKKKPQPPAYKNMSPAKSKDMLNKTRQKPEPYNPQRGSGVA